MSLEDFVEDVRNNSAPIRRLRRIGNIVRKVGQYGTATAATAAILSGFNGCTPTPLPDVKNPTAQILNYSQEEIDDIRGTSPVKLIFTAQDDRGLESSGTLELNGATYTLEDQTPNDSLNFYSELDVTADHIPVDETKSAVFSIKDLSGNEGSDDADITLESSADETAPNVDVYIQSNEIHLDASDPESGVVSKQIIVDSNQDSVFDESATDYTGPINISSLGLTEGQTYGVRGVAENGEGLTATDDDSFTVPVVSDSTPPNVSAYVNSGDLTIDADDPESGISSIDFIVDINDDGTFDEGGFNYTGPVDVQTLGLPPGTYDVRATAENGEGLTATDDTPITVYAKPSITALSFDGKDPQSDVLNYLIGESLNLNVTFTDDNPGDETLELKTELWNGSSWDLVTDYASFTNNSNVTLPSSRGMYRFSVKLTDAEGSDIESFNVPVHDITYSGLTSGTHEHVHDSSKTLDVEWGDLDAMLGGGLWRAQVYVGGTLKGTYNSGTGVSLDFDEPTGEWSALIGRKDGGTWVDTDLVYSGRIGSNTIPDDLVLYEFPGWSVSDGLISITETAPLYIRIKAEDTTNFDPLDMIYSIDSGWGTTQETSDSNVPNEGDVWFTQDPDSDGSDDLWEFHFNTDNKYQIAPYTFEFKSEEKNHTIGETQQSNTYSIDIEVSN